MGWCEIEHMSGSSSEEKAEKMLEFYSTRPLGKDCKYIIAKHTSSCSRRYPGCCTPRIRIDESIIIEK